jgi:hypothetical protein
MNCSEAADLYRTGLILRLDLGSKKECIFFRGSFSRFLF